ncbi:MAG: mechanosensitive ion channel family protein [Faecalibacterium sp.]|nr:mechanosensitive ion channel family protein [Faecalibacterium sp.]
MLLHLVAAVVFALLFDLISRLVRRWLKKIHTLKEAESPFRGVLILLHGFEMPLPRLISCTGVYLALCTLPWAGFAAKMPEYLTMVYRILLVTLAAIGLWRSSELCDLLLDSAQNQMELGTNKTLSMFLSKVYKAFVAAFAALIIINELGFDVTSLITGVGLVGLTISLAAQDTAANLVSGLVILLEGPFQVGDWVKIDAVEGSVEDITFRSTKIRALDNSLYVLPNSSVSSAVLNNGTKRTKRMFSFTLGVPYTTDRARIERLIADLQTLLTGDERVFEDSVIVRLTGFDNSSINIMLRCYIKTPEYAEFLQIQGDLNLQIMDLMRQNGVDFAVPVTNVYLKETK